MNLMTNATEISDKTVSLASRHRCQAPAAIVRAGSRPFRWVCCLVSYGWAAASAHATGVQAHIPDALIKNWPLMPTIDALYPVVGLFAAVASTCILRRRLMAQLVAATAGES